MGVILQVALPSRVLAAARLQCGAAGAGASRGLGVCAEHARLAARGESARAMEIGDFLVWLGPVANSQCVGASTGRAWTGRRARHAQRTPATQATTRGTRRLLRAEWAAATEASGAVARPGAGESTGTRGGAHANSFRQGGEILVG